MRTSECPFPRSPGGGGAECLGTNVVFMNATQDSIFISVVLLFSRQFSREIYLRLNIEAGALYV